MAICDLLGERPLDWAALAVAALLPSLDVTLKGIARVEAHVQTLAREDSDLHLGHVQSTCVLGRVVESDPAQQLGGPVRTQDIDETFFAVGVQIVQHQVQASSRTVSGGEQVAYKGNEVGLAAMFGYDNRSRARLGLNGYEQVASAPTHVLASLPCEGCQASWAWEGGCGSTVAKSFRPRTRRARGAAKAAHTTPEVGTCAADTPGSVLRYTTSTCAKA